MAFNYRGLQVGTNVQDENLSSGRRPTLQDLSNQPKAPRSGRKRKQHVQNVEASTTKKQRVDRKKLESGALHYDQNVDYSELTAIGKMNHLCHFCKALKWKGERAGLCCNNGKIVLPQIKRPPDQMCELLSGNSRDSKHFLENTRMYNNCYQMTSFGADSEISFGNFQSTFKVLSQVYHCIGSLLPLDGVPQVPSAFLYGGQHNWSIRTM